VVAIGSPMWSTASFERIGEAYRNFNKGLLDAPTPRGLDAEQQDLYRSTLEGQALPLEDKATEAFARPSRSRRSRASTPTGRSRRRTSCASTSRTRTASCTGRG